MNSEQSGWRSGGEPQRGLSTEGERRQWMKSPRHGCHRAFALAVPSIRKVLPQKRTQLTPSFTQISLCLHLRREIHLTHPYLALFLFLTLTS